MSDLPEFCHLCGLGFDCDPYEVVAEQMIDDSALGNDRIFTYFAYYHTHCVLELYPRYPMENEAKAAPAPIRPTVYDFDSQVSSSGVVASPWGDDRSDFSEQVAVGENAENDARDAEARPDAQTHAQPYAR